MADPPRPPEKDETIVAFPRRAEPASFVQEVEDRVAEEEARIRGNIAALILAAVLVGIGWFLVDRISNAGRIEDCLMAGRTNCAPVRLE